MGALTLAEKEELQLLLEQKQILKARKSFREYLRCVPLPGVPVNDDEDCEEFYPDQVTPARHHELMIKALQAVASGGVRRLMIFLPPGTAKSSYASKGFPPYFMGVRPGSNIIATSYGSDLAKKFGRACRSVVRGKEYQDVFGATLTGDNAAVDDWSITNGSTYMAGGILSGITGNRADGLLIDDPIKGREEADSETIRDKVWEAYKSDLRTRLKPNAWIAIIETRWHEDDLAGRVLPEDYDGRSGFVKARDGEEWFVVNIPAQCERADDPIGRKIGDYLWTEWFSVEHWEQEKISQGPRNWSALYQQRPSPEEGTYFQAEWFRRYDKAPPRAQMRIYGASDYAVTAGGGDWTVHLVVGVDPDDNIYFLDLWRDQTESDVWIETFLDLCQKWKPLEWAEEAGQIRKSLGPFIKKRARERKVYTYRRQYPSVSNKAVRAQSFRARASMGNVYLPMTDWAEDLIKELLRFTGADGVDDQVDCCSLIGRMLDRMISGERPAEEPEDMAGLEAVTLNDMWKTVPKASGRIA